MLWCMSLSTKRNLGVSCDQDSTMQNLLSREIPCVSLYYGNNPGKKCSGCSNRHVFLGLSGGSAGSLPGLVRLDSRLQAGVGSALHPIPESNSGSRYLLSQGMFSLLGQKHKQGSRKAVLGLATLWPLPRFQWLNQLHGKSQSQWRWQVL